MLASPFNFILEACIAAQTPGRPPPRTRSSVSIYLVSGTQGVPFMLSWFTVTAPPLYEIFSDITQRRFLSKSPLNLSFELNSSLNLVCAQARCANIHMFYIAVYYSFNSSYVGLPSSVCTSVGVGNLDTEGYAFSANFTFSHYSFILSIQASRCRSYNQALLALLTHLGIYYIRLFRLLQGLFLKK